MQAHDYDLQAELLTVYRRESIIYVSVIDKWMWQTQKVTIIKKEQLFLRQAYQYY